MMQIYFYLLILIIGLVYHSIYSKASKDFVQSTEGDNLKFLSDSTYNKSSTSQRQFKYKGMTFVGDRYCFEVDFKSDDARQSLRNLASTGANSVAIVATEYQDYANSTGPIYPYYGPYFPKDDYYYYRTETEEALESIIAEAHRLNMTVMLKPHIDLSKENDFFIWRGMIGENFNQDQWDEWFKAYEIFILKYALLAEKTKSEIFSISCELIYASKQETNWRKIISKIRKVYSGLLVDSANWGGEEVDKVWWDEMDFIGVDAYYINMRTQNNSELYFQDDSIISNVTNILEGLHRKYNKPVMITEIGFCSGNCYRNETSSAKDQYLQAYFYQKMYDSFIQKDWIVGIYWWSWNSDPNFGGLNDVCISPQHKPSEFVLRKVYGGSHDIEYYPKEPKCICTV